MQVCTINPARSPLDTLEEPEPARCLEVQSLLGWLSRISTGSSPHLAPEGEEICDILILKTRVTQHVCDADLHRMQRVANIIWTSSGLRLK